MEVVRFTPEEIDEAIEGMDGLQEIIVPLLRKINLEGMAEQDIQQFKKHIMMAKHALIAMGKFLECEGGGKPSDTIKDFFLDLSRMSGTGNGIGASTIAKLKAFAKEYGYL